MPNAKDVNPSLKPHRILALGDAGGGKSTQIITLPRPCFAFLFDPQALNSIQGHDVDYEEWLPSQVPMAAHSLSKDKKEGKTSNIVSDVYKDWEDSTNKKMESGFFDSYKTICFDSATSLLDLIMDRILTINGRYGQFPHQDDYGPQMVTFMNIVRTFTAMDKTLYFTGHLRTDKDEVLGRILRLPMVTGQLREKLPLLFSDVLVFYASTDPQTKKVSWLIQTTPDQMTPRIRTSIKGLEPVEDVTIDWSQPVEGQGIGGLLKWEQRKLQGG